MDTYKIAVIGFFKDLDNYYATTFLEVADAMDDVKFGITSEDTVFAAHEVEVNKVVLFKKFDEGRNDYDGNYDAGELTKFIKENSLPVLVEFSSETAPKLFSGKIKMHLILFLKQKSKNFAAQKRMAAKIARDHKGKFLCVTVDADKEENKKVLDFYRMTKEEVPGMRISHMGDTMLKYKPDVSNLDDNDEFDTNIRTFVEDYLSGKIKPHEKKKDEL